MSDMAINLDGLRMNAVETDKNGVIGDGGLVRIIENFEWAAQTGGGKNIIQELDSRAV